MLQYTNSISWLISFRKRIQQFCISTDFVQCDISLFPELARYLQGRRFQTADEVKSASQAGLEDMAKKPDEEHFWYNGYVNKQNCRIWSKANPQVYVETPLHPEKLTVWCALWAGGILPQKR
ncbi:hypothetical protein TNCV_2348401 [Trichonephila clavipes]|uniref:Uncharacterized protein n=1 Tax=Trichonephila clavipes TaxID=2585209 RepID=A0A8X6SR65_TRICX|nr:hypothetical protein TNCV_2348401 [Trichonephila clavipes]